MVIAIEDGAEGRTSEDETIVVNLHRAFMATAIGLTTGMGISIHVHLTDKCAAAGVVYIGSSESAPLRAKLVDPHNIWEVPLLPDDWEETAS